MSKLCTIGELASTVAGIDSNNIEKPQGSPEPVKMVRHDTEKPLQINSDFNESPLSAPSGYPNFNAKSNAFNVQHETPQVSPETPQMQHETPQARQNDYENVFSGGSNPVVDPNIFNTSYGTQKADENTQKYSSMKAEFFEPVDAWKDAKNTPFGAYHDSDGEPGAIKLTLMRREFTKELAKQIVKAVGGYDAVRVFREENGFLYVNGCLVAIKLSDEAIACAPHVMKADLARGADYCALDFSVLKKFPNLATIDLQDTVQGGGIFDAFFWGDIGKSCGDFLGCTKIWKKLETFKVTGEDYLLKHESTVAADINVAEEAEREKRRQWKERGKSFGSGLAALLGFKNTADRHPVLSAIGNSPIAKALRHGGLFTGALGIVNLGLMIANPFIVLGSLFTVGAYVAHSVAESRRDNPQYNNGRGFGNSKSSGFGNNNGYAITKSNSFKPATTSRTKAGSKSNNYNNFGNHPNSKVSSWKKR